MRSTVNILLIAFLFYFSSCSKKEEVQPNPTGAVVKSVTHSETGVTEVYTYDATGHAQLIQGSDGSKTTFEYSATGLNQTCYDGKGNIMCTNAMELDSTGKVASNLVSQRMEGTQSFHTYTFDGSGHKTVEYNYNSNHEIIGRTQYDWGGGDNMWNEAAYDSTQTNKIYDTYIWFYDPATTSIGNANTGQKFWGADSKYLPRKSVRHSTIGNQVFLFQYSFDAMTRITEVKTFFENGVLKNTDSYTYY